MNKFVRKGAAAVLLAMLAAQPAIPVSFAEGAEITVSASASAAGAFIANERELSVSSGEAEKYGFTDSVENGVSALDVLVALHEKKYGSEFTAANVGDYLAESGGWLTKAFGQSASASGYLPNHAYTDKMITQEQMSDGDTFEFFFYENAAYYTDYYTHLDDFTVKAGEEKTINSGGWEFMTGYSPTPITHAGEGVKLAFVNKDGTLTPIEGAESDANGDIKVTFDTAGTYEVSLTGAVACQGFNYSTYEYEDTVAPVIPSVTTVTVTEEVKLSGDGTEADPYIIGSYDDLAYLRDSFINKGQSMRNKYFKLSADITLPADWEPIGCYIDKSISDAQNGQNIYAFSGVLDGDNHTVTVAEGGQPLFFAVADAQVKNLNIYGKRIENAGLVSGSFVNYGSDGDYATGVPAMITLDKVTLKSGSSTLKSGLVNGGGSGANRVVINNCTVENDVTVGYTGEESGIGSFVGALNGTISGSVSSAKVLGVNAVGGLAGRKGQAIGDCSVTDSVFQGAVDASGTGVGGILGTGYESADAPNAQPINIENCFAAADVAGGTYVGGILGSESGIKQAWNKGSVTDCFFYGELSAAADGVKGGIVGYLESLDKNQTVANNYYLTKTASSGIGGIGNLFVKSENATAVSDVIKNITTDAEYGIDYAFDINAAAAAATASEFKNGTVLKKLTSSETGHGNWIQGEAYPVFDGMPKKPAGDSHGTGSDKSTITVTITIKGDNIHDSDSDGKVHGNTKGGLQTWVSKKSFTVESVTTVAELIKQTLDKEGMTWDNPTGNYIKSITKDGVTLKELGNGKNSGWLYTLNNKLPSNGIADQYLENGDSVILFYTDDWSTENGNEKWKKSGGGSSSSTVKSTTAPTTAPEASPSPENTASPSETQEPDNGKEFMDVPKTHWAYSSIEKLTEKGILSGRSEDLFAPEENITRAEFAAVLSRMSGDALTETYTGFSDVAEDMWYAPNVAWAVKVGVVSGKSSELFAPEENITRQDMAVMLERYAEYKSLTLSDNNGADNFTDRESVAQYARLSVDKLCRAGVIAGMEDGAFAPLMYASRAQAAGMISRLTELEE